MIVIWLAYTRIRKAKGGNRAMQMDNVQAQRAKRCLATNFFANKTLAARNEGGID